MDADSWIQSGALEVCLETKAPVDPGFQLAVRDLVCPYVDGFERKVADPGAFLALRQGWDAFILAAPAGPAEVAEFLRLLEGCERQADVVWRPRRGAEARGVGRALVQHLEGLTRALYGTPEAGPAHPFFLAAKAGTLAQLQAAALWCRPPPAAVEHALFLNGPMNFDFGKFAWLLEQIAAPTPLLLSYLSFYYRQDCCSSARLAACDETLGFAGDHIQRFLVRALAPARAAELLQLSRDNLARLQALEARLCPERLEDLRTGHSWGWAHDALEAIARGGR